jgi:hypothetical protein
MLKIMRRTFLTGFSALTLLLMLSVFLCGIVATVAGFVNLLFPIWSLLLLLPIFFFTLIVIKVFFFTVGWQRNEVVVFIALVLTWFMHGVGVLVPETGFDAVWYHLPIVEHFTAVHRFEFMPNLYQSVNPLFSDAVFLLGYQSFGEMGAKAVAYLFALSLICVTYHLSRTQLSRFWSLIVVLIVSYFQVLTWQASSFYVDVAKALWELAAVWMIVQNKTLQKHELRLSSLFFGASLATKLFSLFLYPVFLWSIWQKLKHYKVVVVSIALIMSGIVALPFYIFAWSNTGQPFYSFTVHQEKLAEIGGAPDTFSYLIQRTIQLPLSPIYMTFLVRDYTTILLLIFLPFLVIFWKQIWKKTELRIFLVWGVMQWILWWYLPPLSTRYALSGFIFLTIITVWIMKQLTQKKKYLWPMFITICLAIAINLLPRFIVLQRNLKYLSGQQTKEQYLQQFYDGSIDRNLKQWHKL